MNNIIEFMNNKGLYILLICLLSYSNVFANDSTSNQRHFEVGIGLGTSLLLNAPSNQAREIMFFPSIQAFWKPGKHLNIGIETGFMSIMSKTDVGIETEFGKTDFKAKLTAIPLELVFNLNFNRIDLYGGLGIAFMNSKIIAFEETSSVNRIAGSFYYGLGYKIFTFSDFSIEIGANVHYLEIIKKSVASVSVFTSAEF